MSKECTTHHHACDCREEKFKQLELENGALRVRLEILAINSKKQTEEFERENAALARWIVYHSDHTSGDHACAECYPHGEAIKPGFRCAVHVARSIDTARKGGAAVSDTPITDAAYDAVRAFTNEEQAVDALIELRDTSRKLERENAALRADKERLDFLDAIQWHGGAVTSPMMDGTRFRIQVGTRPIISGNTIRAAIDAARKEVQP